ncbi:hypothetical protein SMICM304S_05423 [Streptomyces microflavus]
MRHHGRGAGGLLLGLERFRAAPGRTAVRAGSAYRRPDTAARPAPRPRPPAEHDGPPDHGLRGLDGTDGRVGLGRGERAARAERAERAAREAAPVLPGVRGRGARPPARCAASAGRGVPREGGGAGVAGVGAGAGRGGADGRGCRFGCRARKAGHRRRRPRRLACRLRSGAGGLRHRACRIRGWACGFCRACGSRNGAGGFRSGACRFRSRARGVGHRTRPAARSRACGFRRTRRFVRARGFPRTRRFRGRGFRRRFRGTRDGTRRFHPARRPSRPDRLRLPSGIGSGRRPAATPRGLRGPSQVRPAVAAEVVVLAVGRTACRTRAHRVSLLSLRSSRAPRRAGPAGSPPGR